MEKNKIEISEMSKEDVETLKEKLESDFDDFWNYSLLVEEVMSNISKYYVAKYENEIIGFVGVKKIIDEYEIMNIVTAKKYRGFGVGNLLLEKIISRSKEENISKINLEVNSKNTIAINLYTKYNFMKVGVRKKYYNNIDDAILMTLNIQSK